MTAAKIEQRLLPKNDVRSVKTKSRPRNQIVPNKIRYLTTFSADSFNLRHPVDATAVLRPAANNSTILQAVKTLNSAGCALFEYVSLKEQCLFIVSADSTVGHPTRNRKRPA
jgi:hypothetical protein